MSRKLVSTLSAATLLSIASLLPASPATASSSFYGVPNCVATAGGTTCTREVTSYAVSSASEPCFSPAYVYFNDRVTYPDPLTSPGQQQLMVDAYTVNSASDGRSGGGVIGGCSHAQPPDSMEMTDGYVVVVNSLVGAVSLNAPGFSLIGQSAHAAGTANTYISKRPGGPQIAYSTHQANLAFNVTNATAFEHSAVTTANFKGQYYTAQTVSSFNLSDR